MKLPSFRSASKANPEAIVASAVNTLIRSYGDCKVKKPQDVESMGASFIIPVVLPVETETGDKRIFETSSTDTRDLPLPLLWQISTKSGHDESVVVGRIDTLQIGPSGIYNAKGVFDVGPYGREAERMVRAGFLRGVSADLDKASTKELSAEDEKKIDGLTVFDNARLTGVTIVAKPALQECFILLQEDYRDPEESTVPDGEYTVEDNVLTITASAAPVVPPRAWFQEPTANKPYPFTVEDNGHAHGYLALWESSHLSMAGDVKPPRSGSDYKYFRTGQVKTDDGTMVSTGSFTLVGGHAPIHLSATDAIKHYDDTSSAVVDVVVGENEFGIWASGSLRPDVTPSQVRAMRASAVSGDWRPIPGHRGLELVRACFVNTPGFMTTRAMVASGGVTALVAAGTSTLEMMRNNQLGTEDLNKRVEALENMATKSKLEEEFSNFDLMIAQQNLENAFNDFESKLK